MDLSAVSVMLLVCPRGTRSLVPSPSKFPSSPIAPWLRRVLGMLSPICSRPVPTVTLNVMAEMGDNSMDKWTNSFLLGQRYELCKYVICANTCTCILRLQHGMKMLYTFLPSKLFLPKKLWNKNHALILFQLSKNQQETPQCDETRFSTIQPSIYMWQE